jgi:type IV pilus assembly protein PilA
MRRLQQGFTLIELMIVLVILGILAGIAIPSYQDYIKRAKVAELIAYATAAKSNISEYIITHNKYPSGLTNAGISFTPSQYIRRMSFNSDGTLLLEGNKDTLGAEISLSFKANAEPQGISWTCSAVSGTQYVPASCR